VKRLAFALAAAALAAGVWLGQPSRSTASGGLWSLHYPDPQGKPQALSQWRGQPLVLNFWASWCPPCREEMPDFDRLRGTWHGRGVEFVGIALDTAQNTAEFLERHPVHYPIVVGDASASALSRNFGGNGLPHTVILDREGRVVLNHHGRLSAEALEAALRKVAN